MNRVARAWIGGSHLHMTASRLGLGNVEEVYLSRLLTVTLAAARAAGGRACWAAGRPRLRGAPSASCCRRLSRHWGRLGAPQQPFRDQPARQGELTLLVETGDLRHPETSVIPDELQRPAQMQGPGTCSLPKQMTLLVFRLMSTTLSTEQRMSGRRSTSESRVSSSSSTRAREVAIRRKALQRDPVALDRRDHLVEGGRLLKSLHDPREVVPHALADLRVVDEAGREGPAQLLGRGARRTRRRPSGSPSTAAA